MGEGGSGAVGHHSAEEHRDNARLADTVGNEVASEGKQDDDIGFQGRVAVVRLEHLDLEQQAGQEPHRGACSQAQGASQGS